jgi:hypothetical protein
MRCSKTHRLIGEKLEGTIGAQDLAELKKHLEKCADCRDLMKDFESIAEDARSLPKREPSGRVWTAIVEDVRKARRAPKGDRAIKPRWLYIFAAGRPRWAWAAALTLVIVGGIVAGIHPWRSAPGPESDERFAVAKLKEAENYYRLAIKSLGEAIGSEKNGFDPQVAAMFAQNLKDIDAVIQDCRTAVTRDPNDVETRLFLLDAYKNKVAILDNLIDVKKRMSPAIKAGTKI